MIECRHPLFRAQPPYFRRDRPLPHGRCAWPSPSILSTHTRVVIHVTSAQSALLFVVLAAPQRQDSRVCEQCEDGCRAEHGANVALQASSLSLLQIEEFWQHYSHIAKPYELPQSSDYHLFRKGVKPMWEVSRRRPVCTTSSPTCRIPSMRKEGSGLSGCPRPRRRGYGRTCCLLLLVIRCASFRSKSPKLTYRMCSLT